MVILFRLLHVLDTLDWLLYNWQCTGHTTELRRRHAHPVNKTCRLLSRPEASSGHSSNRRAKQASRW